ncbi:MAG: preprotein translocase subunit SecA [Candidatus Vogelbacteria bacterium]|nr:preprotein translocase subunit SecA [Candidatus Vogelbacteria bacterium]
MSLFGNLFGDHSETILNKLASKVQAINDYEEQIKILTPEALKAKTAEFRDRLKAGNSLDDLIAEAFAVVREAARRTLGQRHYDVQLLGGLVLHQGAIAEMKTGEGKTLVATLPAYLNALSGQGVHIVTVNDYLARRDAVWMGQIYDYLGLSVSVLNSQISYLYDPNHQDQDIARDTEGSFKVLPQFLRHCNRQEAYLADITYGTNNEFGFDYLRDHLVYNNGDVMGRFQGTDRVYPFAIIDEVDSILIDESRTPLIISAPVANAESWYATFANIARRLNEDDDFTIDHKLKAVSLTEAGIEKAEQALGIENIYTDKGIKYVHHLETATKAKALYQRDKEYVVKDGEIIIVDEFTGRLQPGRRWSEGLHQAIEAKEGVKVREESRTFATVTLQNYFRLYQKLAGMTGTAKTSAEEFRKVYGLDVVAIPSNQVSRRQDLPDVVLQSEAAKFRVITKLVKELQTKGQPVLVGTVSIEKNELLSAHFRQAGIAHKILNAKNHEEEGVIIAAAGAKSSVVIATNMAGRGVDIKLGGTMPDEIKTREIQELGGLYVIGTERHEARRIDNQLRGRAGRQGDPGTTVFYLSLEDSLMKMFGSDRIKSLMTKLSIPEDEPITHSLVSKSLEGAQEKIEGLNFDTRKHLLEYDDVINHQRVTMYERRQKVLFGKRRELEEFVARAQEILAWTEEEIVNFKQVFNQKEVEFGTDKLEASLRTLILQVIDLYWVEHLEAIDYLRSSVRLRAYGQRDPLVEFKREGLRLFKDLEVNIFAEALKLIPNLGVAPVKAEEVAIGTTGPTEPGTTVGHPTVAKAVVGRNDPCPCGSGKKYKKCHGA